MIVLIGVSGINHIIGHILMMQCFPSISCFDSGSISHFRPELVQRFICFNQIEHFVLMERVCLSQMDLLL